jgi:hypothetical protein
MPLVVFVGPAIIMVPFRIGAPPTVSTVPPLVVCGPAMFSFSAQLSPTAAGFRAIRAVFGDGSV